MPAILVALSISIMASGSAAIASDELAARQLENGDRLARDGKLEQAQSAWSDVVASYPDAPAAPVALDRLGSSFYPVEQFRLRGVVEAATAGRARPYFQKLATDYRTSLRAPRALFKLGLMYSDPGSGFYELDEAYAQFSTLVTVHPDSELVSAGQYGLADVLAMQGEWSRALAPLSRLIGGARDATVVAEARELAAQCLLRLGHLKAAARALQLLRDEAPESPLAGLARDRLTHIARILASSEDLAEPLYHTFAQITPQLGEDWKPRDVTALAVDPDGRLVIADGRKGGVHLIDGGGGALSRLETSKPTAVWVGEGEPWVASDGDLVRPSGRSPLLLADGRTRLTEIGFLARDARGRVIVWDQRSNDIYRFRRDLRFDTTLVSGSGRRIDSVASTPDGTLYLLNGRDRQVEILSSGGLQRSVSFGLDRVLSRPQHLAVDFLGNLFILDTTARAIGIFEPDGGRLIAQVLSGREPGDPFPRPVAMAVNQRGEILLYDMRHGGVVVVR